MKKLFLALSWFFTILLCAYGFLANLWAYVLWPKHWAMGFVCMSVPLVVILDLISAFFWLFVRPRRAILPLVMLLCAWPFLARTLQFHKKDTLDEKGLLKIMSYNAMFFDYYQYADKIDRQNAPKLIEYAIEFGDADVKVFQEFFDNKKTIFKITERLQAAGYRHYYLMENPLTKQGFHGLAIFSKYPMIKQKSKYFSDGANGFLIADIIYKKDTIRLINSHLYSMGIRINRFKNQGYTGAKIESKSVFRLLKKGFNKRNEEVDELEKQIKISPYPVLLCGDFNETPYGYAYGKVGNYLENSFENAGNGFGFTYNHSPQFIRIDNQFYDAKRLQIVDFKMGTKKYSDHYPLLGTYKINSTE